MNDAKELDSCAVLIPAYDPDERLVRLVHELQSAGFTKIVLINDGSKHESGNIFDQCRAEGALLVEHPANQGKGAAIRSGLEFICASLTPDHGIRCVVTVDADGQHLPADVRNVALKALNLKLPGVILGVRRFDDLTPARSRFGNTATRLVFRHLTGTHISDTQTGLRAFSTGLIPLLLEIPGNRYEYEINMLAVLVQKRVPIVETTISTIYIDNNSSSHFRPVADSVRIYTTLLKDLLMSLASFGLDVAIFSVALHFIGNIIYATFLARSVSVVFNFVGNKYFVFNGSQRQNTLMQVSSYALVAIVLATASGRLVNMLAEKTLLSATLLKIIVDLALYIASFVIRRQFIFRFS